MASIYIFNLKGGKCVELSSPEIEDDDIDRLRSVLPRNLEGISFESPLDRFDEDTVSEIRLENKKPRVAEYLRGIGNKLEQLQQAPGAVGFYDLAFRLTGNKEFLILKARTLGQIGQVDRAEYLLRRYSQDNPKSPEPYFHFGKHALSRGDYQKAKEHFEKSQSLIRPKNVEHKKLESILPTYIRFVSIYLDRDRIFSRDLPHDQCIKEIQRLQSRTRALVQDIRNQKITELDGMIFFLETQDKIFDKWLEEMHA